MKLSKRLNRFPEYVFSELGRRKREVEKKTGRKVLDLSIGTPTYPPSKKYIEAFKEFIEDPHAHLYPGYGATGEFSSALINWYKERFGVSLNEDELLPLIGGKDGVAHLPLALLDAGGEALVPDPGYPGFSGPVLMFDAKVVTYNLTERNGFKPDLAELEKKVSDKTSYMWVNFPSNPTGQVASLKDLAPLVNFAKKHNIILVYDNAYAEITYGFIAPSILEISGAKDVAVELGSFSKSHSFAGFRMGWMVGNKEVIGALAKVKSQMDSGMTLPLQMLGAYALTHPDQAWKKEMLTSYIRQRDQVAKLLAASGFEFELPKGGLYIWAKIPAGYKDSLDFCLEWLARRQILFAPGVAFGKNGKNYVRVCFSANIEDIEGYF